MSGFSVSDYRPRLAGIFIISFAALAYQVILTRIFSVMLYYHYAFAGISLAMLGITIGAEKVYLQPKRFQPERFNEEWAKAALGFALSSIVLVVWFLYAPLLPPPFLKMKLLVCSLLLFIIPFTYSGICVTLILTGSRQVGKLYAADLAGAALGAMGMVFLLFLLEPITILFLLAAFCAYAARFMLRGTHSRMRRRATAVMCSMFAAAAVQGTLYLTDHSHLGVVWAKVEKEAPSLYERWNAYSQVRVTKWDVPNMPFGWGFGRPQTSDVKQLYLDIDAGASTIITHFTGDLKVLSYLSDDVINVGYHIRPPKSVVVIGLGGGRDLLSALYFGASKIIAIELNPAIIDALTRKFADFAGHVTERPEVTLVNAEARSWLAQHPPKVDLVQISLIDTWAATAAGGLTLSENKLYTLEAWNEFLNLLTPDGMMVVSRWYDAGDYRGEFYRMLSLAADSLVAHGVPRSEVRKHILGFAVDRIVTVAVSPNKPFSDEEVAQAHKETAKWGFKVVMAPDGTALDDTSRTIASGQATPAFYDGLRLDVTTPTDNRPFFFYMTRARDSLGVDTIYASHDITNKNSLMIMIVMLVGTLLVTIAFVLEPLVKVYGHHPLKKVIPELAYFACIGVGFMLIEISQMQRLIVFLGHPVFGLSVVLFTLLVFGGIGSATVHDNTRPDRLWKRPLLLVVVLCAVGLLMPALTAQFVPYGTVTRILVSILLLAPAGFCMGMMFPAGMLMTAEHRELQPWFWGINGSTSVFASILGSALSMIFGISTAYWTGVGVYALCIVLARMSRPWWKQ